MCSAGSRSVTGAGRDGGGRMHCDVSRHRGGRDPLSRPRHDAHGVTGMTHTAGIDLYVLG